jgi:HlyD family secretion protein
MAEHKNGKNRHLHLRLSWIIAALVIIAGAVYLSLHHTTIGVRSELVVRQNLVSSISTNGQVEPITNFEAHAPSATTVLRVFVHEGEHVRRGQMLVQLDDSAARAQAARANAQLKSAEADRSAIEAGGTRPDVLNLQDQIAKARSEQIAAQAGVESLKRLQQTGAASAGEVQQAQARLDSANATLQVLEMRKSQPFAPQDVQRVEASVAGAQAALAAAQEMLRQSSIRSAVDGTVYQIPVRQGKFVNAGDLVVQVANLKDLQVRAFVDEPEIGKLRVGQPVTILWDALPTQSWHGQVKTVPETVVPRNTRTVAEVLCSVDNTGADATGAAKLLPNVNVNVAIQVARADNVLTVPREAVHQDGTGRFVLVVRDGRRRRADRHLQLDTRRNPLRRQRRRPYRDQCLQ